MNERDFDDGYQNEAQREVAAISRGYVSEEDPRDCPCRGCGWILSDWDVWVTCPLHYKGGPDPETRMELIDSLAEWEKEWDAMTSKERHEVICRYARWRLKELRPARPVTDEIPF